MGNYYQLMFAMKQHHGWGWQEIESLVPWERDIMVALLEQWIKSENDRIRNQNQDG